MTKKLVSLATAVVAVALLAGCSTGGSGSGATTAAKEDTTQSQSAACKAFESKVKSAAEGLQSEVAKLQSDPQAAVAKLKEFDASLSDGVDAVTNPTVKPKAEAFHTAYADMLTQIEAIAKDPQSADISKFTDTTTKVQEAGNDFQKVCTS
ncbi:hypothetical protein [Curtobacterium pusillum]|uniref:hypothetical protein n=1 Tax=Curtobacterium pusillum TaxID=69373 RepID=UPI0011A88021|nr:hypothetical protein [Curtobacterium pusillum]